MSTQIRFAHALFELLEETFEHVHGIYMDQGTTLFETLDTISAEEASRPVAECCTSIAAQTEHIRLYLSMIAETYVTGTPPQIDWAEMWRTTGEVTSEQWTDRKAQLCSSYQQVKAILKNIDTWEGENEIGDALALLAHSAFHLGQIRQSLCTVRQ